MRDKYVLMRKYDYDSKQNTSKHNLMMEKILVAIVNDMWLFLLSTLLLCTFLV